MFLLAFGGLFAAVYFHGAIRAVFGVGGAEENPMETDEAIRGLQVAISGKGPHKEMADSMLGMFLRILFNPLHYGLKAIVISLVGIFSLLVWIPAVVLSLKYGVIHLEQLTIGHQLVVFAEFAWILQWAVWRFFTPSYLLEEDDFG